MRISLMAILLIGMAATTAAQDLGAFEEVTAGNFFGFGARQMSMGGAGIASSWDGAALYYNPAALARIHRIEFQLGLSHQKFSNETWQPGGRYPGFSSTQNSASDDLTKTRFSSINLSLPAPTYRGSLVVAFGVNRVISFDRIALYNVIDDSSGYIVEDYGKEFETGGIMAYSVGVGMDISPNLSVGLAANVYSGKDEFVYDDYYFDEPGDLVSYNTTRVTEDYIGISLKGGLLARPNPELTIGLAIETPVDYQVEYTFVDDFEQAYVEYDLSRPFIFGAGLAYRFSTFTISGDAEYIDWSQLSYNDNPEMEEDNDSLAELYHEVFNLRIGGEYQIPSAGLALRAGLFRTPLTYADKYIKDNRTGYTLGVGWLIDKVLMLETAFVRGSYKRTYTASNNGMATAEDSFSRLYVTMSYRY